MFVMENGRPYTEYRKQILKTGNSRRKGRISFSLRTLFLVVITSTLLLFYPSTLTSAEPDCDNPGVGDVDFCLARIEQEINALKPAR